MLRLGSSLSHWHGRCLRSQISEEKEVNSGTTVDLNITLICLTNVSLEFTKFAEFNPITHIFFFFIINTKSANFQNFSTLVVKGSNTKLTYPYLVSP